MFVVVIQRLDNEMAAKELPPAEVYRQEFAELDVQKVVQMLNVKQRGPRAKKEKQ